MEGETATEVQALVNSALREENLNAALGLLARARLLQPKGELLPGVDYAVSPANPENYYAQRRELIYQEFESGYKTGTPPTIASLAGKYNAALSTVHAVKKKYLKDHPLEPHRG